VTRSVSPSAAIASGAGQVAGRLCYRPLVSRLGPRARLTTVIAAGAAATLLLGLVPGPAALLIATAVIAGAIRGVFTLTEATLAAITPSPGTAADGRSGGDVQAGSEQADSPA
jgi:Na+/melibiose symporter-like transporter